MAELGYSEVCRIQLHGCLLTVLPNVSSVYSGPSFESPPLISHHLWFGPLCWGREECGHGKEIICRSPGCLRCDCPPVLSCPLGKQPFGTHPGSASQAQGVRFFWFLLFSAPFVLCMKPFKRFLRLVLRELIYLAFLVFCF